MNINKENKIHEMCLYTNINPKIMDLNNEKINNKVNKNEENKISGTDRVRIKARIMDYKQRDIQDRMSFIQSQEAKIDDIEKTLEMAKYSYSEKSKHEKQESIKEKIKIRQLSKNVNELEDKVYEESLNKNKDSKHDNEKVIAVIEETLRKIDRIKSEITKQKSKLIYLEAKIQNEEVKLEKSKNDMENDFILNQLDFISIEENVDTGITINIIT